MEFFKELKSKNPHLHIVGVNQNGEEIDVILEGEKPESRVVVPVVVDDYKWSRENQIQRAMEFRDRIEYLYHPEEDKNHPMMPVWRQDDTARLKKTLQLPISGRVLETGCSSGTVTIELAKLPHVDEIWGTDIRDDAIEKAWKLVDELYSKGHIGDNHKNKINFQNLAIEDLNDEHGQFDTVCAFEVLEHIIPSDFDKMILSLKKATKPGGKIFISVPNRYPDEEIVKAGRFRWQAPDHKNYFSLESMKYLLERFFDKMKFHNVGNYPEDRGVYVFVEIDL